MNRVNTTKTKSKPTTTDHICSFKQAHSSAYIDRRMEQLVECQSAGITQSPQYVRTYSMCSCMYIHTLKCVLLAVTGNGETVLILLVRHQLGILNRNNTGKLVNGACLAVKTVSRVQRTYP